MTLQGEANGLRVMKEIMPITRRILAASAALLLGCAPATAQTNPAPPPAYCAHIPPPSQGLPGATSFTYRIIGNRLLRIHIFAPDGKARRNPAAIFFFGGGFRVGDAASYAGLAKAFVAHGYVAALADYRVLCRDNVGPTAGVDDAEAALSWVRGHAAMLHIDRRKIVLVGGSAGGMLAASAAMRVPNSERPAALILFNPVLDLETGLTAHDQSPAQALAYSPIRLAVANLPPAIIFHGTTDHTVPIISSRTFCARVTAIGRPCQLVEYQGMDHSFADKHDIDPKLGISMFDDTLNRALFFLASIVKPDVRSGASPGDRYVAMGSSYAAGPGLPPEDGRTSDRCGRSAANYAHLLARRRSLDLVDVSCGGATTANILAPWGKLPAQIDAVTTDTRLVTITIGGNDVGFVGGLIAASYCNASKAASTSCRQMPMPDDKAWLEVGTAMHDIVGQIRHRAPAARIIFVDYLTVLPPFGACQTLGLSAAQADASRAIAKRLATVTAQVATSEGVDLLRASALSREHDACSRKPWTNGNVIDAGRGGVRFHPNEAGMTAVAGALEKLITD